MRTDIQLGMTKLIIVFRNFLNAPKKYDLIFSECVFLEWSNNHQYQWINGLISGGKKHVFQENWSFY